MPTYTNSTAHILTLRGGTELKKHQIIKKNATLALDFYPISLPTGVTFVSHEPIVNPFKELAVVDTFPSEAIVCYGYASLIFKNATGDTVMIYANGDDTNTLAIEDNTRIVFEADGLWGTITFVSGGEDGDITLWGSQ